MINLHSLPNEIWGTIFAMNEDPFVYAMTCKGFQNELNERVINCLESLKCSLIERPNALLENALKNIEIKEARLTDIRSLYHFINKINIVGKKAFLSVQPMQIRHEFDDLQRKLDDAFLKILPKMAESAKLEMPKTMDIKASREWFAENLAIIKTIFVLNIGYLELEVFPPEVLLCTNLIGLKIDLNRIRYFPIDELKKLPLTDTFLSDSPYIGMALDKERLEKESIYKNITQNNPRGLPTTLQFGGTFIPDMQVKPSMTLQSLQRRRLATPPMQPSLTEAPKMSGMFFPE